MEGETRNSRSRGALGGVIAPVVKATAVLARDVALEPALLPGKGRMQTKEGVMMGSVQVGKENIICRKIMHFFSGSGDR
jgi:hypothetical protein